MSTSCRSRRARPPLSGVPLVDLGNVAILPGLINAHTHLEFSDLRRAAGRARANRCQSGFAKSCAHRREAAAPATGRHFGRAGRVGPRRYDHARRNRHRPLAERAWAPRRRHDFFRTHRTPGRRHATEWPGPTTHLDQPWPEPGDGPAGRRPGLSPHAPYSVHPELFRRLVRLAGRRQIPLAMHLAESPEEFELLAAGTGPFRDLLVELGVWSPDAIPRGTRVLDYLRQLTAAPRTWSFTATTSTRTRSIFWRRMPTGCR